MSLRRRFCQHILDLRLGIGPTRLHDPTASLHIIHHRGQRLVQFMGQGRGHLAHSAETRHVGEFRLNFLNPLQAGTQLILGLAAFCDVPDKPGEAALVIGNSGRTVVRGGC